MQGVITAPPISLHAKEHHTVALMQVAGPVERELRFRRGSHEFPNRLQQLWRTEAGPEGDVHHSAQMSRITKPSLQRPDAEIFMNHICNRVDVARLTAIADEH